MKHQYKKKPKQEQIERLLNIYAAIGAAAKEQPAPNTPNETPVNVEKC